ncbi:MAG: hypothetical protein HOB98_15750 [Gammaproteobacteria bacterium]|nr:hypothetical protein [Gammaproteobacteria bacterium]MBT4617897.1 hypothetical protein [Gammaproteobacteria bacterium]MBT5197017.1 hypothetical protein [Gammaproteobacteria bacterium]MBT6951266.1 hypothetical protein [Gammaproteobacteria bacterium]MBT7175146.1 hypothetical protein [Gammaproteobacteria bacterium]
MKTIPHYDLFDGFHQRRRVNFSATQLDEIWRRSTSGFNSNASLRGQEDS